VILGTAAATIAGTAPAASRTHRRTPEFPIGDPVPTDQQAHTVPDTVRGKKTVS
jgi:hypothetical protein